MLDGKLLGARTDGGVKVRTANYARCARVLRSGFSVIWRALSEPLLQLHQHTKTRAV